MLLRRQLQGFVRRASGNDTSFDSLRRDYSTILNGNQLIDVAFPISHEDKQCRKIFDKEAYLGFGQQLKFWLSGPLGCELVTLSGDVKDKARRKFVLPDISVVNVRIQFDRCPLGRKTTVMSGNNFPSSPPSQKSVRKA